MKKSEIAKKDREFSAEIRSVGFCQYCGRTKDEWRLHTHHAIIGRRVRATRWDKRNGICLCFVCHQDAHDYPELFAKWYKNRIGEDVYDEVVRLGNSPNKYKWEK